MEDHLSDSASSSQSECEYTSDDDDSNDSDKELQIAFQKGLLKPGLQREVKGKKEIDYINNIEGLKEKLQTFNLSLPWLQTLTMSCKPAPLAPELATQLEDRKKDTDKKTTSKSEDLLYDDFAREMLFYRLGQAGVLEGIPRLHALGIPTKRPDDYFAEMAKSDDHMHKVREKLKVKENAILVREKAKKLRELKKFGKKVQAEKNVQKQEEKRKMLEQLKKYRKGKMDSLDFLDENPGKNSSEDYTNKSKNDKKPQNKRNFKNKKFGVAGKKRGWKRNAAGDVDSVLSSNRHNKFGKGKQNNMKNKRPGKNFRDKIKSNKGRKK